MAQSADIIIWGYKNRKYLVFGQFGNISGQSKETLRPIQGTNQLMLSFGRIQRSNHLSLTVLCTTCQLMWAKLQSLAVRPRVTWRWALVFVSTFEEHSGGVPATEMSPFHLRF